MTTDEPLRGQELLNIFNPRLKLVEAYRYIADWGIAYQVTNGNNSFTFKAVYLGEDPDLNRRNQVRTENRFFDRVDGQDIPLVVKRIDYYGIKYGYEAILKEHAQGSPLFGGCSWNRKLNSQVRRGINRIHSLGISNLDIQPANIIISPDSQLVKLIDFGICVFKEDDDNKFIERQEWDSSHASLYFPMPSKKFLKYMPVGGGSGI